MHNNTKLRGGRRHFHVILFILFMSMTFSASCTTQSSETSQSNSSQSSIEDSTFVLRDSTIAIEYRTPEEQQIQKLYKLITQVSPITNENQRKQLAQAVYTYGAQYSIDPLILLSIAKIQSNFRKTVMGYGNCYGYFQINLNVHRVSSTFRNSTNEQTEKACQVFSYCRSIYGQNLNNVLNSYNGYVSQKNNYAIKVLQFYNNYKRIYKEI